MTVEDIARICHEANRALCATQNDFSQPPWEMAPDWQKDSAVNGVRFHVSGKHSPEESHGAWLAQKTAEGWKYGPVKDPDKKEHPCMVPYDHLPVAQQAKDHLFMNIVAALKPFLE